MKTYKVNVNGTEYQISIELMSEEEAKKAQEAPASEPKENAPAPKTTGEGVEITAPMQGTILSIKVKDGDSVSKGQVLFVLEAMKMENEIMASEDGTVSGIAVQEGATVSNGTVLCTIA